MAAGTVTASSATGRNRARSIMRGILEHFPCRCRLSAETADVRAEAFELGRTHPVNGSERSQIPGPRVRDGAQNAVAEDEERGLALLLRDGEAPLLEPLFEGSRLRCEGGGWLLAYLCRLAALLRIAAGTLT